jgi:hypothetical protein
VAWLHKGRAAIILFNLGVSMYMTIMKNTINKNYASEHMTGGICMLYRPEKRDIFTTPCVSPVLTIDTTVRGGGGLLESMAKGLHVTHLVYLRSSYHTSSLLTGNI